MARLTQRLAASSICLLLGLTAAGCSSGSADAPESSPAAPAFGSEERSVPVTVASVQVGSLSEILELTGTVQPWDTYSVTTEVSGRVEEIHVQEGDWIEEGQVLLELDRTKRELELRTRRAQLEQGMVELDFARKRLARADALLQRGAISQSEVDTLNERVKVAQAGVEVAELAIESMEEDLNDTLVTSPVAGQITSRFVSIGEVVGPMAQLFTVLELNPVKVLTEITEPYLLEITAGQGVRIRFDAIGQDVFTGIVHRIHPVANAQSSAFPLEISLRNGLRQLLPGMVARIELKGKVFREVTHVPLEAVVNSEGSNLLYVVRDGKAHRQEVEVVERLDGRAIVEGQLTEGESVVVQGNRNLTDLTPVEVTNG